MATSVAIGILGLSTGFFGVLWLSSLGCELATGDTWFTIVSVLCPL